MFLNQVRIVLVNTSHPGNIGAAARAMKTMGLQTLYLVNPKVFPHPKANEMASHAEDVLASARVVSSLQEAIADCALVVGTTARERAIPWPLLNPREMATTLKAESAKTQMAVVFGREQTGLTNEEIECCQACVHIPANPSYSSLNLAAAVQLICYELRMAFLQESVTVKEQDYRLADADEMEKLFEHLQTVLVELSFLKANAPRKLMTRLRRFFLRARPDVMEMNIFRGFLNAIQTKK